MSDKHSVAGICYRGGKILIAHRLPIGQMGNRWEFPGGKVENGEGYETTLMREYEEEFNAKISVGKLIAEAEFVHNEKTVGLHAFEVFFDEEPNWKFTEHSEIAWVDIDEIPNLFFVDSDLKLYDDVKKYVTSKEAEK